jgi:hypothetical protein
MEFARRTMPMPAGPVTLTEAVGPDGLTGRWELICRDGWEWREAGPGQVLVRVAALSADQAAIVQNWIERIKDPAVWWAVSRELQAPESEPEVYQALTASPWLSQVLPVLLEASTEGAPPPPPDRG